MGGTCTRAPHRWMTDGKQQSISTRLGPRRGTKPQRAWPARACPGPRTWLVEVGHPRLQQLGAVQRRNGLYRKRVRQMQAVESRRCAAVLPRTLPVHDASAVRSATRSPNELQPGYVRLGDIARPATHACRTWSYTAYASATSLAIICLMLSRSPTCLPPPPPRLPGPTASLRTMCGWQQHCRSSTSAVCARW